MSENQEEQWSSSESTSTNLIPKSEAKEKIKELAESQGVNGVFKVFYDGQMVSTPNDLPEMVDLGKVRVSAVLDQAK